jgi:hypothetical protein
MEFVLSSNSGHYMPYVVDNIYVLSSNSGHYMPYVVDNIYVLIHEGERKPLRCC